MSRVVDALELADGGEQAEGARSWYRNRSSGQLGYQVVRNCVTCIKYDRNAEEIVVAFKPDEWVPDVDKRPLLKGSVAQLCQLSDRELCKMIGLIPESRKSWMDLSDLERQVFLGGGGPKTPGIRQRVYRMLWDELIRYAR